MRLLSDLAHSKYSPEPRDLIWTVPNVISVLRICSIPVFAWLVACHSMALALIVLACSAISDAFDGIIARSFNQVSRIGQLLDPIADRLLILSSIAALSWAHIIPWWMVIIVLLREVSLGVLILILAQHGYGPLPVHFVGKTGTALLMGSIVMLIFADLWSGGIGYALHTFGIALAIWGVSLYWVAGLIYWRQSWQLLHEPVFESSPKRAATSHDA